MTTQTHRQWFLPPIAARQYASLPRRGHVGQTTDSALQSAADAVQAMANPCSMNGTVATFQTAWNASSDTSFGSPKLKVDDKYGPLTASALTQVQQANAGLTGPMNTPGPCAQFSGSSTSNIPSLAPPPSSALAPADASSAAPWPWWKILLLALLGGTAAYLGVRTIRKHSGYVPHPAGVPYSPPRRSYARATQTFPEFDRGSAHPSLHHSKTPWIVGGVAVAGLVGAMLWRAHPASAATRPSSGPTPYTPAPQTFWNSLGPAEQALYEKGLYNWMVQAPNEWPSFVAPLTVSSPADLADSGNLAIATDAIQTAKSIKGSNPGVVDKPTYDAAVAYAGAA